MSKRGLSRKDESEARDSDDDPEWLPNEDMESKLLDGLSKVWKGQDLEIKKRHIQKRLKLDLKRTERRVTASSSRIRAEDDRTLEELTSVNSENQTASGSAIRSEDDTIVEELTSVQNDPGDEISTFLITPAADNLYGKKGYKWFSKPTSTGKGKTPSKNIIYVKPGPSPEFQNILDPVCAFQIFFSGDVLNTVVEYTNQKICSARQKYDEEPSVVSETSLEELKALLGLYILAGVLKDNHLATDTMFNTTFCGTRYKATMSQKRFEFLTACLRFDDTNTREERRQVSRFAPIEVYQ